MKPFSIPSPPSEFSSFSLGIFTIHAYALCILLGIVVALLLTSRRLTRRGAEPGIVVDIALWAVPIGIVGARIYHVLTHPDDYFYAGADLLRTLYIWEGGNAIFGSLLGGAVGAYIGCRMTGIRFWSFADALAPGMLLAQAIGRIGNWFNEELFGQPTTLPWGLEVSSTNPQFPAGLPEGTLFHPTFLYELLWNSFGALLIILIEREFRLQWGKTFALYLIWYGAGRTWFESIRIDTSEIYFGLRVNVWAAIIAVAIGVILFLVQSRRHTGLELSPYVPGRQWSPTGNAVDSVYTDSDFEDGNVEDRGDDANESSESVPARKPATSGSGAPSQRSTP